LLDPAARVFDTCPAIPEIWTLSEPDPEVDAVWPSVFEFARPTEEVPLVGVVSAFPRPF
jgi:hypothetical protein